MARYTDGPWHTVFNDPNRDGSEVCSIYDASNDPTSGYVADVYRNYVGAFIGEEEYRANAHLIAAAPELLSALKALRSACMGMVPECAEQVDAAIAKAEGGTPIVRGADLSPAVEAV